ncbi:MAG: hypothetical protein Q9211_001479 [Gyalolechia sp. 1 TL-2023]
MSSFSHPHNYYNNPPSQAWKVINTDLITVSFAVIIVLLRCYTKYFITKSSGWDDYTCILALLFAVARTAVDCVGRYELGAGRHFWDIPPEWHNGFLTTIAVDGYLYIVAITLAKLSLLIFLYRIFHVDRTFRIIAWLTGAILVIWGTTAVLLAIFACRPIKASWDLDLLHDPKTKCKPKAYNTENVYGFCNIITDFVLMIMPIPLVWNMQLGFKKKIGIVWIFATGALYVPQIALAPRPGAEG